MCYNDGMKSNQEIINLAKQRLEGRWEEAESYYWSLDWSKPESQLLWADYCLAVARGEKYEKNNSQALLGKWSELQKNDVVHYFNGLFNKWSVEAAVIGGLGTFGLLFYGMIAVGMCGFGGCYNPLYAPAHIVIFLLLVSSLVIIVYNRSQRSDWGLIYLRLITVDISRMNVDMRKDVVELQLLRLVYMTTYQSLVGRLPWLLWLTSRQMTGIQKNVFLGVFRAVFYNELKQEKLVK